MSTNTFATARDFSASAETVFAAFTDPVRLARWWGPAGFTNAFETCDFTPGGRWVFTMIGADGTRYANEAMFAVIEPNRRVVIQHVVEPLFELTVTLDASAHGTRVGWVQVFADAALAQAVRHIVEPANEQNLDRLAAEVQ